MLDKKNVTALLISKNSHVLFSSCILISQQNISTLTINPPNDLQPIPKKKKNVPKVKSGQLLTGKISPKKLHKND